MTTHWTAETILETLYQQRGKLHELGVVKLGLFGSYGNRF